MTNNNRRLECIYKEDDAMQLYSIPPLDAFKTYLLLLSINCSSKYMLYLPWEIGQVIVFDGCFLNEHDTLLPSLKFILKSKLSGIYWELSQLPAKVYLLPLVIHSFI